MPTIDLGASPAPAPSAAPAASVEDVWSGLPRRVGLTLPELRLLAGTLHAPLPFDPVTPEAEPAAGLAARLGLSAGATQDRAYLDALGRLGDPLISLQRRGLLVEDTVDPGIAGALGLLAAPSTAVDLDVAVEERRAHAWHRQRGGSVATLATSDGLVFELAWFGAAAWPLELGRAAAIPEETRLRASLVPTVLEVPWQLADAAAEAAGSGRPELIPILAGDPALGTVLTALAGEARGRLRALVTTVAGEAPDRPRPVGVAAWTLLADGWHALRPRRTDGTDGPDSTDGAGAAPTAEDLLGIVLVEHTDLAAELAPLLAEVA